MTSSLGSGTTALWRIERRGGWSGSEGQGTVGMRLGDLEAGKVWREREGRRPNDAGMGSAHSCHCEQGARLVVPER